MLLRRVARPMLAALFIQGGINSFKAPAAHAQAAKPVLDAVAPAIDRAAEAAPINQRPDDEMLIKLDGVVKIAAGTMLALGRYPRVAATALAATLIPTTLAGHRFWEEDDPQRKQEQQVHFLKNVSMFGGLLIAAADTEGRPSLGWKGRKAAKLAAGATAAKTGALSGAATGATGRVTGTASDVTGRAAGALHGAGGKLAGTAHEARGKAAGLTAGLAGIAPAAGAAAAKRARRTESRRPSRASEISAEWSRRAAKAQRKAEKRVGKLQKAAAKRQGKAALKRPQKQAPAVLDQAGRLGHDIAARATAAGSEVVHQASGLAKDARKRAAVLTH